MIKKLSIIKYRKISDMELSFNQGINVISGTNGTCKTSLLHIISNSFQAVNKSCKWVTDKKCIEEIKKVNNIINPKIESLTRGDKQYTDPARGQKGSLYTIEYYDNKSLDFRRHNSSGNDRYSIKPYYPKGSKQSLPYCMVLYLGLARLFPFGEFQDDDAIKGINKSLPLDYQREVSDLYKKFTGMTISSLVPQKMGNIKTRADFSSDQDGIDSNTISAGEDNLFIIITALVSLKYYYKCIKASKTVESILLIDELDATLHPALQIMLLDLFNNYSKKYKIQIVFTTHSLSLLEDALNKKYNVIYLIDNITSVVKMEDPDIYKIKMFLNSITKDDIYLNKVIPVFTEDNEARTFLNIIFEYYNKKYADKFSKIMDLFHFVECNIGAENLLTIFNDDKLIKSTMRSICILDGDHNEKKDYSKCVLVLPGDNSPEEFIMKYSKDLYDKDDPFWVDETILQLNYGKLYYRDNVLPDIEDIDNTIRELKNNDKSTKGVRRDLNKKTFIKHQRFFTMLFKYWTNAPQNQLKLKEFYKDLQKMFKKVAEFHGINPNEWKMLD